MFIRKTIFEINLMTILILSIYTTANAATVYGCKDKNGRMSFSNSACISPSTELFHRSLPGLTVKPEKAIKPTKTTTVNNTTQATSTTTSSTPTASVLPTSDTVFAKTSFWYTPIPKDTLLAANSDDLTNEFLRQKAKYYGTVTINTYSYSAPVYTVDTNVKSVVVGFNNCQNKSHIDPTFTNMMSAVPIPNYAQQSSGTDGEMAIYQPSTNSYWELWKAKLDPVTGAWSACWGGKLGSASLSDGVFQSYYGTTATSLPFIGGQITAEELARGEIKHAIGISLVDLDHWNVFSYPAHRSDGYNPLGLPNRIAEGQRFRLDPTINVDTLTMSKAGKVIAKAAQKYGFVVWDHAGAIGLRAQNAKTYIAQGIADPYPDLYENKAQYAVLSGFPWSKLQFMPMNYGKP